MQAVEMIRPFEPNSVQQKETSSISARGRIGHGAYPDLIEGPYNRLAGATPTLHDQSNRHHLNYQRSRQHLLDGFVCEITCDDYFLFLILYRVKGVLSMV
jgi:hypothetical protein